MKPSHDAQTRTSDSEEVVSLGAGEVVGSSMRRAGTGQSLELQRSKSRQATSPMCHDLP
jgi:hypothetical protein